MLKTLSHRETMPPCSGGGSLLRLTAWAGFLLLLGIYGYLSFRGDSSFFTVPWMPREIARRILSVTNYRNFWGFGFMGAYCAVFLGAWWWLRHNGRWQWATIALWLMPVLKELMQISIHGRHGTLAGALYGMTGVVLGLASGSALRTTVRLFAPRRAPLVAPNSSHESKRCDC